MKKIVFMSALILFPFLGYMQNSIDAGEIISKLNKGEDVNYKNVNIVGDLDFRQIKDKETVPKGIDGSNTTYKYHVRAKMSFSDCTFKGKVIGYYNDDRLKEMHIALFHGDIQFEKCTFNDEFLVKYSVFDKLAVFANNHFGELALFKYVEFNSVIDFSGSVFEDIANFKYAQFPLKTDFSNSRFEEEANFKYTQFGDKAGFKDCEFLGLANFKYTDFSGYADFTNSKFNSDAIFKYTEFPEGVSFENAFFDDFADFKYAQLEAPVNLNNVNFDGSTSFKYTRVEGKEFKTYLLNNK